MLRKRNMLEHEQPSRMPMVTPFDGYVETMGKVSSTCLVIEDRSRYSMPCEQVGQKVSIRIDTGRIDFAAQLVRVNRPIAFLAIIKEQACSLHARAKREASGVVP